MTIIVSLCTIDIYLPEARNLKDKRSTVKSIIKRLHNQFNLSVAEVEKQDLIQSAVLAMTVVSNSERHSSEVLSKAIKYIEENYPQIHITSETIEAIL